MKYHISFDLELKDNPYKGKYIALEGIDGSGKSTQLHLVEKALQKEGLSVILTSEPKSDSVVGKIIRKVLSSTIKMPSSAMQYLMSADRVINHETIVKPALQKGKVVLTHRSFWSVIPYGVMDRGLTQYDRANAEVLMVAQGLLSMYHQFISPDVTFYLDVPIDVAMKRLVKMDKTKEIYEKKEKLTQIAKGYEWEMARFPGQFVRIDGTQPEEKITEEIVKYVLGIK
ncbi:MAG TPA: dTMP kinase [Candidatus Eisenbacteria bacterium]|nr:dTMP kinase [Candidatus Eisenbacteria bacterium]